MELRALPWAAALESFMWPSSAWALRSHRSKSPRGQGAVLTQSLAPNVPPSIEQDRALGFLAFISSQSGSTQLSLSMVCPPECRPHHQWPGPLSQKSGQGGSLLHRCEGEVDKVGCVHMYFHSHAHRDPLAPDEAVGREK